MKNVSRTNRAHYGSQGTKAFFFFKSAKLKFIDRGTYELMTDLCVTINKYFLYKKKMSLRKKIFMTLLHKTG